MLLVDDNAELRALLGSALVEDGCVVVGEAADGLEGIEVAGRSQPDVIVLDLLMPVMDGLEALPFLRRACPTARVIVYSTFGAPDVTDRARAAGAAGFIRKGDSMAAVARHVAAITSGNAGDDEFPLVGDPV